MTAFYNTECMHSMKMKFFVHIYSIVDIVEKFQHQTSPISKQQTQIYQGVWGLRYASGIRCTEMRANSPLLLPYINIYGSVLFVTEF